MNIHTAKNLSSLFLIQGSNALFPLILYPFLFTVLDNQVFSVLVLLESVMLYIIAFSIYSFDVTGVKDIGLSEGIKNKVEIFYDILLIRLSILLVVSLISLLVTFIFFKSLFLTLLLWLLFPLGMVLQCNYYHQAVEKNAKLAAIVFVCRLLALVISLVVVNNNSDLNLAVFIIGFNYFLSGLLSLVSIAVNLGFSGYKINKKRLQHRLNDGLNLYLGGLSVALFRGSNIILLSFVSSPGAVAIYALAEKYIRTVQAIVRPLNQFAYPKVIKDIKEVNSVVYIVNIIIKRTLPQVLVLALGLLILLSIGFLVKYYGFFKNDFSEAFMVFFVMSIATIFGVCNYMFGTVGMTLINSGSYYAKSVFIVGILSVLTTLFLGYYLNQYGAALAYVLAEALLLILFIVKFHSLKSY